MRVSAPAQTSTRADEPVAVVARSLAVLDRALPFLGPGVAALLGVVAVERRSLTIDEGAVFAAARGSFSDVVDHALSHDPAKAGYLALMQPIASRADSEIWLRLPSVIAAVVAAIAAYRLGRRLAGRHAGAAASLILASSVGVVSVSRTAGPLALAVAAMLVSSALFARAVDDGNVFWWALYAVSAALLPLTHPIAASALAAQLAALVFARRQVDLRLALPAATVALVECGFFLTASAVDRADAPDGTGPLELGDVGAGVARAVGWSPVVSALAIWGVVALARGEGPGGRWKAALVTGLAVMPVVFVLGAGVGLPVYPRVALTVSAGGVALGAGVGLFAIRDATVRLAAAVAVAVVAIAALGTAALRDQSQNWRAAAKLVRASTTPKDTVVVLPQRARAVFSYYAPEMRLSDVGRGEAVLVVFAGDPDRATASGREVVARPRYALLTESTAGGNLVVERWVRP
jgi:mannosyltransferase